MPHRCPLWDLLTRECEAGFFLFRWKMLCAFLEGIPHSWHGPCLQRAADSELLAMICTVALVREPFPRVFVDAVLRQLAVLMCSQKYIVCVPWHVQFPPSRCPVPMPAEFPLPSPRGPFLELVIVFPCGLRSDVCDSIHARFVVVAVICGTLYRLSMQIKGMVCGPRLSTYH